MKHIIVPIDFSEEALHGLEFALVLAGKFKADVQMVHVCPPANNKFQSEIEMEISEYEEKFIAIEKEWLQKYPDISLQHIAKRGKIYREVVNQADSMNDSCIVCSTHGGSGFEEFFIGSNAYKIISYTTLPVFTVRGNIVPSTIKRIVLPIDITLETREKVPFTTSLAGIFDAEVHVVTLSSTNDESIQKKLNEYSGQVIKYLNAHSISYQSSSLQGGNQTDIILDYAKKSDASLISIMSDQEKTISNLLLGSYTHQMINKSTIPVLINSVRQLGIISESFRAEGIISD
jgi:nucleotide-binding universal stress UspA family protein